jgi:hypothetical protein
MCFLTKVAGRLWGTTSSLAAHRWSSVQGSDRSSPSLAMGASGASGFFPGFPDLPGLHSSSLARCSSVAVVRGSAC